MPTRDIKSSTIKADLGFITVQGPTSFCSAYFNSDGAWEPERELYYPYLNAEGSRTVLFYSNRDNLISKSLISLVIIIIYLTLSI